MLEAGPSRPFELVLEHHEGSPRATLHPDHTRARLIERTRLSPIEQGAGYQRLIQDVRAGSRETFSSRAMCGTVAVTLCRGIPRVEVKAQLSWEAFCHPLRVAVPVPVQGRHLYGTPHGMVEREPYETQCYD